MISHEDGVVSIEMKFTDNGLAFYVLVILAVLLVLTALGWCGKFIEGAAIATHSWAIISVAVTFICLFLPGWDDEVPDWNERKFWNLAKLAATMLILSALVGVVSSFLLLVCALLLANWFLPYWIAIAPILVALGVAVGLAVNKAIARKDNE